MVASKEVSFSPDGREVSICACQKAFMHLHSLHFLWELATLAHACGCCALAAGLIYDEGLYTVGLVPCTLAGHLHCYYKDVECCLAVCGL